MVETQRKERRKGHAVKEKGSKRKIILLVTTRSGQHSVGHYLSGDLIPEDTQRVEVEVHVPRVKMQSAENVLARRQRHFL